MSAPTEEEIRAALAREWGTPHGGYGLPIEGTFSDAFTLTQCLLDGLFDTSDLRESEQTRLDELTDAAVSPIRDDATRRINEAMVAAALTFALEHPSAPRATRTLTIA
jgi:ADP-ribosylglycohydrolase